MERPDQARSETLQTLGRITPYIIGGVAFAGYLVQTGAVFGALMVGLLGFIVGLVCRLIYRA